MRRESESDIDGQGVDSADLSRRGKPLHYIYTAHFAVDFLAQCTRSRQCDETARVFYTRNQRRMGTEAETGEVQVTWCHYEYGIFCTEYSETL